MKLEHIYATTLHETLDSPLPFAKLSDTRYVIDLEGEKIFVVLFSNLIGRYKCLAVSFVNPNSANPMAITNFFNGPTAVRIFSTVVAIVDQVPFDIIVFTPDDITVEIRDKKLRLYQTILKKLERIGKVSSTEKIMIDGFDLPILVGIRNVIIDQVTLGEVITQFGIRKMM